MTSTWGGGVNRLQILAELVAERFGAAPVAERYARPSPPPVRERRGPGSDQTPTRSEAHDHQVPKIIPARPWVCAGCGGPAHPDHAGWRCPICGWSAYQSAPKVEREVAGDG